VPCDGEKFVIIGELASKEHEVFAKVVFSGQDAHSCIREKSTWKMIDFLVGSHLLKDVQLGNAINPSKIKVHTGNRINNEVPAVLFSDMFNDSVLSF
jgi:hypothetical protein